MKKYIKADAEINPDYIVYRGKLVRGGDGDFISEDEVPIALFYDHSEAISYADIMEERNHRYAYSVRRIGE